MSYSVVPNGKTKELDLKLEQRQCMHRYHYWMHPELGFMHGRIQMWFPFRIQMCLNGREWLARQMDRAGMGIARALNPIHEEIFRRHRANYYWTIPSSEYATDVVFERQQDLQRLYPLMAGHAILNLSSPDVLRFLGRKIAAGSPVPAQYTEELFKAYTAQGSVLRVETTKRRALMGGSAIDFSSASPR